MSLRERLSSITEPSYPLKARAPHAVYQPTDSHPGDVARDLELPSFRVDVIVVITQEYYWRRVPGDPRCAGK